MPHRLLLAVVLVLLSSTASGASSRANKKQVEYSMLVTGRIAVAADGNVRGYAMDSAEKLPRDARDFIQKNLEQWKFVPPMIDGRAAEAQGMMSLRLIGKKVGDGKFDIRLGAISFDTPDQVEGNSFSPKQMGPPRYPASAERSGASGVVYLLLRIGRDGKVEEAVVEQVNLRVIANDTDMKRYRDTFSEAALEAARAWEFTPPVSGPRVGDPHWIARVPLDFAFWGEQAKYGQWEGYVPGPYQSYAWAGDTETGYSPDALPPGRLHPVGKDGLRLLKPPGSEE